MSNNEIENIFRQDPPPVSEQAKARAKAAALRVFREEQKKVAETNQGNPAPHRPTHETKTVKDSKMKAKYFPYWATGLAASILLAVGLVILLPTRDYSNMGDELPFPEITSSYEPLEPPRDSSGEADAAVEATEEEIVTQGIRSSLEGAAQAKREPSQYTESVTAQDIGQMSDTNIAESLQRIHPGAASKPLTLSAPPPMDDTRNWQQPQEYRDRFENFQENPVVQTRENPVSTFSIDVDTAAYSFVRRQLNSGYLPQKDAVRIEEMINYFDYDYPLPQAKSKPFKPNIVVTDSPWKAGNKLVHIGIKGYEVQANTQPDSNLVFLLDVSGSMDSPDKLPLVKQSMELLLSTLKPTDTISIVVYAGAAGAVLEPTPVKEKAKILNALQRLQAGGSTAGAQGLTLAYQQAELNFKKDAVNRVILATDGDFNVGITQDERLEDFVARKRDSGIYLSVLGFGQGNYQDALMQTLAQNGNGVAAYIDTLSEAQKVLVNEATSSLFPIANDVKIQIEFNPATVKEYRLIGYETRALKREDFNNDKVDAGDIGAGHTVTAIYEITPADADSQLIDELRYSSNKEQTTNKNEYGFFRLRYKLPGKKISLLIEEAIQPGKRDIDKKLQREVNFANAVAGFAQILRGGKYIDNYSYDDVIALAQANKGDDAFGYRTEFVQLVRKAKTAKE